MSDDPIRDHLAELRRELGWVGSLRRRRLLAEVEDHLREAAAELGAQGVEPTQATRDAVEAFGGAKNLAGTAPDLRLRLGICAVIALATVVGLLGFRHSHSAPIRAGQRAAVRISPAALIRSIERGLSRTGIVSVRLGRPPIPFQRQQRGPWMYVRVRCLAGAGCLRGQWEAEMLAAAYHVSAPAHGLRAETGTSVYSGRESMQSLIADRGNSSGGPVHTLRPGTTTPVPFSPTRLPARVLTAQITRDLRSVHLTPMSITFDRIDGYLAPVIVADAPYPGIVIRHPPQWTDAVGREPNRFEGVYLRLNYPDGRPAMAVGMASRTATGMTWIKPRLNPNPGDT